MPAPTAPKDAGERDSGGDGEDGGETQTDASTEDAAVNCKSGPGNYEGFGTICRNDGDCTSCFAPTCATAPINLCSRVQCQNDPETCPPGWACTDITAFSMNPDVTHICLKF